MDGGHTSDTAPAVITRAEALARGLKRYFTGRPCKNGHVAPRRVDNNGCRLCGAAVARRARAKHGGKRNVVDPILKVARDAAIEAGASRFFTGVPCAKGHVAERYVGGIRCVACQANYNNPDRTIADARKAAENARAEAKARGFKTYWTGVPCKHGHLAERKTSSRGCVECGRIERRAFIARYPEKEKAQITKWRASNLEKIRIYREDNRGRQRITGAAWAEANRDHKLAKGAKWRATNRERHKKLIAAWNRKNPGKVKAKNARRRARKLNALCTCCTSREVAAVYINRPKGHDVDHIRALALGGLECVKNLQVLPRAVHRVKTTPDLQAVATAKFLIREQRAGRIPGDPAKTAAYFRMQVSL